MIMTPGHTPGHLSLFLERTGVLITGDALFNFRFLGGTRISPAFLCSDFAMTKRTAHRLGEMEYDVVAFTHGPEIRGSALAGRSSRWKRSSWTDRSTDRCLDASPLQECCMTAVSRG